MCCEGREYEEEAKRKKGKKRGGADGGPPDTGQWECVYRAKHTVTRPLACLSHEFVCVGTAIGPSKRKK